MPSQNEIYDQLELLAIHRRNLALYLKQQANVGSAYITPSIANGIYEERNHIQRIKKTLRDWSIVIEDHPDDDTPLDLPGTPINLVHPYKKLYVSIVNYFNEDSLQYLVSHLGVDYEAMAGEDGQNIAYKLVLYCQQHELIDTLKEGMEQAEEGIYFKSHPSTKYDDLTIPVGWPSEFRCKFCRKLIRLIDLDQHYASGIELSSEEYDFVSQNRKEIEQRENWEVEGLIICRNCKSENVLITGYITARVQNNYMCFKCKKIGYMKADISQIDDWPATTFACRVTFILTCENCNRRGTRKKLLRSFLTIKSLLISNSNVQAMR